VEKFTGIVNKLPLPVQQVGMHLFQLVVPLRSKASDQGVFKKDIYRHLKPCAQLACGIAYLPAVIIDRLET
jgi:hypothetical protein